MDGSVPSVLVQQAIDGVLARAVQIIAIINTEIDKPTNDPEKCLGLISESATAASMLGYVMDYSGESSQNGKFVHMQKPLNAAQDVISSRGAKLYSKLKDNGVPQETIMEAIVLGKEVAVVIHRTAIEIGESSDTLDEAMSMIDGIGAQMLNASMESDDTNEQGEWI